MRSYKNWKLVNESMFPLGLSQPHTVGGVISGHPLEESKKKKDDDMGEEKECSCNKMMKKKMKDESKFKNSKQTPKDHSNEKNWSKEKKKKMGDEMEAGPMMKKKKPVDDDMGDDDDDDVEDDKIEDDDDVDGGDDDSSDDDMDDDGDGDEKGDEEGDHEGDEGDDEDHEMKKYGFMKKKMKAMKKKMKKMKEESVQFAKDLDSYPDMPQDHSQDSEKEFFASLTRQFGKPNQKFSSGLSEDLLIPLNDPNAPEYTAPENEPGPGEVGYAPQGRMGVIGSYAESTEFTTLCKYLGEEAARKLYRGKQ